MLRNGFMQDEKLFLPGGCWGERCWFHSHPHPTRCSSIFFNTSLSLRITALTRFHWKIFAGIDLRCSRLNPVETETNVKITKKNQHRTFRPTQRENPSVQSPRSEGLSETLLTSFTRVSECLRSGTVVTMVGVC